MAQIDFQEVPALYRQAVLLSCTGRQLLNINFFICTGIDITLEVLPCSQLQEFSIAYDCTLGSSPIDPTLQPDRFLSNLKKMCISVCLGKESPFFHLKLPSLTELSLNCCHLDVPSKLPLRWTDVPNLWPNLRVWEFGVGPNFRAKQFYEFAFDGPSLKKLEKLTIRCQMSLDEFWASGYVMENHIRKDNQPSFIFNLEMSPDESHECFYNE